MILGKTYSAARCEFDRAHGELIARPEVLPALVDMLIEAAKEVNGSPGVFKRRGEFPAAIEHDFPISTEASRYYKNGKSLVYHYLPYWLASRVNTILVALCR